MTHQSSGIALRIDSSRAIERYQQIVRFKTISRLDESEVEWGGFEKFKDSLPALYPSMHAVVEKIPTATRSLLYRWKGTSGVESVVLMAHYDVVGVGGQWSSPPFAGNITGEGEQAVIHGRGVIDDKASLVGILEAVDLLAASGFSPADDIYLAFSHNEEVLGDGTPDIVGILQRRGIRPRLVLDEGGIVGESIFPGVSSPVVQVGVSEKGTATVRLTCTAPGGHASVPPRQTSTVQLARTVVAVADAADHPHLNAVTRRLISDIGRGAEGPLADAAELLARGADDSEVIAAFAQVSADARAMVHSSAVVTMLAAGHTTNAVPEEATATVNLRILVGDTAEAALARLSASITDPAVQIAVVEAADPSPVSPSAGREWEELELTVRETYGEVVLSGYVNNGGTDSRNYTGISDTVYRFSPCHMTLDERRSIHAIDEHLRISSFTVGCEFYVRFISRL